MSVAEAARVFEAVAERPVHADMGDPDEAQSRGERRGEPEANEREREGERIGVSEVVGRRATRGPMR